MKIPFEHARRYVGMLMARWEYRKSRDSVIAFNAALSAAHSALLIMPLRRREFLPTVTVIELLKRRFRDENITVISDDHGREVMRMLPRGHFVHIIDQEITPWFLPTNGLLQRIRERHYDVAIDLNLDFELPSAYICKASNARVRIGFMRNRSDLFFNFQIQPDLTKERKYLYDRVAAFLEKF